MKTITIPGLAVLIVFILVGCRVAKFEKDKNVDFSKYKSFAWVDQQNNGNAPRDIVERNLRDAVNKELADLNWRHDTKRPDILLKQDILVEKKEVRSSSPLYSNSFTRPYFNPYSRRWGYIYYPPQFMGYDEDNYEVREGTITITMIDPKTDRIVWQGWVTNQLDHGKLTTREAVASVKSIFKKFDIGG